MSITLPELQEFIAGFWYHYDEAHHDELAARYAEDVRYVTRSRSGASPFEEPEPSSCKMVYPAKLVPTVTDTRRIVPLP
jgi:hypothetical protein